MVYKSKTYSLERELYHISDSEVIDCSFNSESLEGESPIKESRNTLVSNCEFYLRYPMWHGINLLLNNSKIFESSRAPLWYCKKLTIQDSNINGTKAIRECNGVIINNLNCVSDECLWDCKKIMINNSSFTGYYFLKNCKGALINKLNLDGKYSFQYVRKFKLSNSTLKTKDAFWHTKHGIIKDSVIEGEYIGWYSKHLTFINCTIKGTQPFCYCKHLKLINCKLIDCDLAFEASKVEAIIDSSIKSIKNPRKGMIVCNHVDEIILNDYTYKPKAKIIVKDKEINNKSGGIL